MTCYLLRSVTRLTVWDCYFLHDCSCYCWCHFLLLLLILNRCRPIHIRPRSQYQYERHRHYNRHLRLESHYHILGGTVYHIRSQGLQTMIYKTNNTLSTIKMTHTNQQSIDQHSRLKSLKYINSKLRGLL